MKYILFFVASLSLLTVSCQKNGDNSRPAVATGTVKVRLQLTSELQTTDSPLPWGRHANNVAGNAKTLRDSTIYAVIVYRGKEFMPFSSGLFNRADSIFLVLPKEGQARISAYAFKKGTGEGLFYTMQNGMQYFDYPVQTQLTNEMDTLHRTFQTMMWDTVSWLQVTDPANLLRALPPVSQPDVDAYFGSTTITTSPAPPYISLQLKRISYGLQLSAVNFTAGKLIAEFPDTYSRLAQSVTPANINSAYFICATDSYKHADTFPGPGMNVRIRWEKPDGSSDTIGVKYINFKRNVLTRLQVVIPGNGRINRQAVISQSSSPLPE